MRSALIATSALVLALGATPFAVAQSTPAPAPTPIPVPTLPASTPNADWIRFGISVGQQILQHQQQQNRNNIRGSVSYFKRYDMQVSCGVNCYRNVRLHPGTIINPRGGTPSVGTSVDVNGHADADGTIEADTITIQQ